MIPAPIDLKIQQVGEVDESIRNGKLLVDLTPAYQLDYVSSERRTRKGEDEEKSPPSLVLIANAQSLANEGDSREKCHSRSKSMEEYSS